MRILFYTSLIVFLVLLSTLGALAQKKRVLPDGLKQDSSVSEIVTWLDQTSFRNARVVLKNTSDADFYSPPWDDTPAPNNTFIFTQGFRVTNIDGCNLMLRNDDVRTVVKSKVEEYKDRVVADVWVQLNRMSPNRGKHAHRYTTDPEKVNLLGAWRTDFGYRGWSSNTIVGLTLSSPQWKEPQRWQGMNVAFTFDTKEMAEKFDAAFRQAIRLCQI
jgi:hypothetical protein